MRLDPLLLLVLLLLLLAAALALGWWRAARRWSRASRRRNALAQRGEEAALRLLEAEGYEILDRQVPAFWTMVVDGEPVDVHVRADFWVARGERRYVAEVKTGRAAPDPTLPATRRQLLEYQIAFEPDGLLLVDAEEGRVVEIELPIP